MSQLNFWSITKDMMSNIYYPSAPTNFDKQMFALGVIITKQLLTKQFSINAKSSGKRSARQGVPRECH